MVKCPKKYILISFGFSSIAFIIPSHYIVANLTLWMLDLFSMSSGCQTVEIQIKSNILLGLICVQTVSKGYQQNMKVAASRQKKYIHNKLMDGT